jgi:cytochrome b pre-mRNA-processing protein 3
MGYDTPEVWRSQDDDKDGTMVIGLGWRRRRATDDAARALYDAVVERARNPVFYTALGVPDTLDGRFDLVLLHAILVMRRLTAESDAMARDVSQALYDTMFADMDESLREIGVGDLSIGKKVRVMTEAMRGRSQAYATSLDDADHAGLVEVVRRNIYGTATATPQQIARLAAYIQAAAAALAGQGGAEIVAGQADFGPLPDGE